MSKIVYRYVSYSIRVFSENNFFIFLRYGDSDVFSDNPYISYINNKIALWTITFLGHWLSLEENLILFATLFILMFIVILELQKRYEKNIFVRF